MDISQVQKQRDAELEKFKQEYSESKQKYLELMQESTQEPDSEKQAVLVGQVLEINSELAKQVRDFVHSQPESGNTDLTSELIKIQKEYNEIGQSTDRRKTLEMILNEDRNKVQRLKWQFDIVIFFLILSICVILFIILRVSISRLLGGQTLQLPIPQA